MTSPSDALRFTDDDLKRLKELCAKSELKGDDVKAFDRLTCVKIDALIARLEAAENVIKTISVLETWGRPDRPQRLAFHDLEEDVVIYNQSGESITAGDVRGIQKAIIIWRKVCGK